MKTTRVMHKGMKGRIKFAKLSTYLMANKKRRHILVNDTFSLQDADTRLESDLTSTVYDWGEGGIPKGQPFNPDLGGSE